MRGIKIPQQDFTLKMQGGLMREGGVFAGHYGIFFTIKFIFYKLSFLLLKYLSFVYSAKKNDDEDKHKIKQ